VHLALAEVALYSDWDWSAAEDRLERALAANPNLAEARYHNAWDQLLWGRVDEAIVEMERATHLDPFTPKYEAWLGSLYWTVGRHDEAIEAARRSLEVSPDFPIAWYVIGLAHAAKGEYEEALAAHQRAAEHPHWRWPLANTYALAGRTEEARALLAELTRSPTAYGAWGLAEIYATLGERDEALRWLERCVETRVSVIPWLGWYPGFASLRDDPRFRELERRMNLVG
jgi:tetratricopeptide (TPR) repeat protein